MEKQNLSESWLRMMRKLMQHKLIFWSLPYIVLILIFAPLSYLSGIPTRACGPSDYRVILGMGFMGVLLVLMISYLNKFTRREVILLSIINALEAMVFMYISSAC